jgi:hypothetical protein
MQRLILSLVVSWAACFVRADIIHGKILWCEDALMTTNTAVFSFDMVLQSGSISNFWIDENGTWTYENGFLADGNYNFTVSSVVTTYAELTDFDVIQWSIYEERILGAKVEDVSGILSAGRFQMTHWIYIISPGANSVNGTFSVIPEPATALLFGLGGFGAWLLRNNLKKNVTTAP